MKKSKSLFRVKSRSFGLIEVMVAAGVFILFAGALISLSLVSSRGIVINKHRLQAANLARGGIELVRQIRDTAWLQDENWPWTGNCWGLSPGTDRRLVNYSGEGGCTVWHYHLVPGSESITQDMVEYTRTIRIDDLNLDPDSDNDTKKITVTVSWQDFGQTKEVKMITYLTDWR